MPVSRGKVLGYLVNVYRMRKISRMGTGRRDCIWHRGGAAKFGDHVVTQSQACVHQSRLPSQSSRYGSAAANRIASSGCAAAAHCRCPVPVRPYTRQRLYGPPDRNRDCCFPERRSIPGAADGVPKSARAICQNRSSSIALTLIAMQDDDATTLNTRKPSPSSQGAIRAVPCLLTSPPAPRTGAEVSTPASESGGRPPTTKRAGQYRK